MTLLMEIHRAELYLNVRHCERENLSMDRPTNELVPNFSMQFDCSIHNCSCRRRKTGLILYPEDIQMKNVILLVCEECFHYELENGTSHAQLEKWYFNIYKDSQSFQFKCRFWQNEDNSFSFESALSNTNEVFNIEERDLENWEKETIERIVQKNAKDQLSRMQCNRSIQIKFLYIDLNYESTGFLFNVE